MLPTCFPSTHHPTALPYKPGAARRIGSRRVSHRPGESVEELSGGTGRQCRGAAWRHWGQCSGAVRHWGSSKGHRPPSFTYTDGLIYNYSNRIQSFTRCSQPGQPGLQHQGTLHAGIGATVPSTVPEEWDPPSRAGWPTSWCPSTADSAQLTSGWCDKRGQGLLQHTTRDALWCHALGKRKGIWCLVWSFGNALCLYVNGLPYGSLTCSNLVASVES